MTGPRIGDAFGEMLLTCWKTAGVQQIGTNVPEMVERDDGFISVQRPARYFAEPAQWRDFERTAVDLAGDLAGGPGGMVLDVGCGAGRFALALQERGVPVTGLDTSAGAAEVSRRRGVRDVVHGSVAALTGRYATFLLMGENIGLLESARRAGGFLAGLAAAARPGARIIGHGADPAPIVSGAAGDAEFTAYLRRNTERGRLPGELTIRVRHRDLATPWFGYLLCSPAELAALAEPAGWRLDSAEYADKANYLAVLTLASSK
ncbi:MAG TPA: methyltransferase domain-containing protein [Streptosporangiaceae bacterium]|nr:methyltransferase domain-containing protein [Streptosporangiaceae bacterium]